MSHAQSLETLPPHRRRPTVVLALAGLVIALLSWGLISRVAARAALNSQAQSAGEATVITAAPQPSPALEEVVLPGEVKGVLETPIYARTSGYVRIWKTDIGARVKSGDLLAVIDSPEVDQQLRQAEADLKTAQANSAVARSTADRVASLVATQSVSRQEGEDRAATAEATASLVASNQANVERLRQLQGFERVVAPFSGVITARSTDVGNLINAGGAGTELFRIADVSKLRTFVDVPQSYASEIKVGTTAELHFPDHPGKVYPATVTRTASAIDPQARTLTVELDIDNSAGELFPGSFTEAHFKVPPTGHGLRLSGNTLLFRAEGLRVAVVGPDNRVRLKAITIGRDFGSTVEVLDGIAPTDRVILNPTAAIENGDRVHVAAAKAPAQGARS